MKVGNKMKIHFLKAVSNIHAGASEANNFVDKPIQREMATYFPKIEGSSMKGAVREQIKIENKEAIFGMKNEPGILTFTDLKILLFPVTSSLNLFAYVTCPYILNRLKDELIYMDASPKYDDLKKLVESIKTISVNENICYSFKKIENISFVLLGDCPFDLKNLNKNKNIELECFKSIDRNIFLVSNNNFRDLTRFYTEVIVRNRILEKTGTAKDKGLFTEEYLPAESVLYGFRSEFTKIPLEHDKKIEFENELESLFREKFYIGGNRTLGKGILRKI